jgi:hypothetical protein
MRTLALTLLTIAAAAASDIEVHDFRAEVGISPGPSKTDDDFSTGTGSANPAGRTTYKSNAAPCFDLWAGWAFSEIHDHGPVFALGLDVARGVHSPKDLGSSSLDYITVTPQIRGGWAYAFNTSFHLEFTPFLGYGVARTDWADGSQHDSGWGTALTYGMLVGGWARMGRGYTFGGNVGYQGGLTNTSVDFGNGAQSDLTMHTSGIVARVGMGYQF